MERIIFESNSYDFDEVRKDIFENGNESYEDITEVDEQTVYDEMSVREEEDFNEEKHRLEETFDDRKRTFVLRGTAGTWRGRMEGGAVIRSYAELSKAWNSYSDFKIYEEDGLFSIDAHHHDGTDEWKVRELTERGKKFLCRHEGDMEERKLHDKLFSSPYSKNIGFCNKYYGYYKSRKNSKKGA